MGSPISSLSAELLTLILDLLINDTTAFANDPIACGPEDDTVVATSQIIRCAAQVCSGWRSVCLGNPLWWSTISIVHPWTLEDVKIRLERAQQCSLDLRIFGNIENTTRTKKPAAHRDSDGLTSRISPLSLPTLAMCGALFEVIFPTLERCRVLHVRGVFTENALPFQILEHMADTSFPVLEHLVFEGDLNKYTNELAMSGRGPFFSSTPNLKQLRLIGVDIRRFLFSSPSFLSSLSSITTAPSLTTLHLSRASSSSIELSFTELKYILGTGCPLLSTLAIYNDIIGRPRERALSAPITCTAPSLKSLYILGDMLSVSELLLFLHAPKMTELVIAPISTQDLKPMCKHDYPLYGNPTVSDEERAKARAVQIKSVTNRYPCLTQLTLAPTRPQDLSDGLLVQASMCFPLIERLIVLLLVGYQVHFKFAYGQTPFAHLADLVLHLEMGIDPDLLSKSYRSRNGNDTDNPGLNTETQITQLKPEHRGRLAAWAKTISEICNPRERKPVVPLRNVFVDEITFRAFQIYAKDNGETQIDGDPEKEATMFDMPDVKVANIWEDQRRRMLFTQVKDLFLGKRGVRF